MTLLCINCIITFRTPLDEPVNVTKLNKMIFDLVCVNHAGKITSYGYVEANSPEDASADSRVGRPIKSSKDIGGYRRHCLVNPPNKTGCVSQDQTDWYLQEIKPLMDQPQELQ